MRILIVEDEPLVARRLRRLVMQINPDAEIREAGSLAAGAEDFARYRCDVLLLDLNLRGEDGFSLLERAVAGPQQTIVVSANTDRAIEAFEYGVIDFVPKPFTVPRLAAAFDRLREPPEGRVRYLSFRLGGRHEVVKIEDVRAIHGADNYAEVELSSGRRLLHDKTLDRLDQLLDSRFLRVHRSHIVNLAFVRSTRSLPGSRYRLELQGGEELPVSRARIGALRAALGQATGRR